MILFYRLASTHLTQCDHDTDGSGDTGRAKAEHLLVFFVEQVLPAEKQRGSLIGLVAYAGIQQGDRFDRNPVGWSCCNEFTVMHLAVVSERQTRLALLVSKGKMSVDRTAATGASNLPAPPGLVAVQ